MYVIMCTCTAILTSNSFSDPFSSSLSKASYLQVEGNKEKNHDSFVRHTNTNTYKFITYTYTVSVYVLTCMCLTVCRVYNPGEKVRGIYAKQA